MTMTRSIYNSVFIIGNEIELHQNSTFLNARKGQRIEFNKKNKIFFLKSGEVSIFRNVDHLQTLTLWAPAVIGLTQIKNEDLTHYLRCDQKCEMWEIDVPDAISLFNEKNLWPHAFNILSYLAQEYFKREYMISQKTSHGVVYQHLKYIWSMDISIRRKISVYKFILSRNHISRSAVHKVICQLTQDGMIKTERGKLVNMHTDSYI